MTAGTASNSELSAKLRFALGRLYRQLRKQSEEDLTPTQASALYVIEQREPIPLGHLAAAENMAPPSVTRIVSSLEERGLVQRSAAPDDRRGVVASLTPRGRELIHQMRTRRNTYLARKLADLSPDDRRLLEEATRLLERLAEEDG
jgi:DNA-binding MarR family transcriptional regulator